MKLIYLIVFILLLANPTSAVNWECHDIYTVANGTTSLWKGVNFTYSGVVESVTHPGYWLDLNFGVDTTGLTYKSTWINGASWETIYEPNFEITPLYLLSDSYADLRYCVETDYLIVPTATPTTTPTSTTTSTVTATVTATEPGGTIGDGGTGIRSRVKYNPDDTTGTYSHIPTGVPGFNDILSQAGYCLSGTCTASDISGYLSVYINSFWWVGFGTVIFRFSLFKKGR